jgi:hypothetical protein
MILYDFSGAFTVEAYLGPSLLMHVVLLLGEPAGLDLANKCWCQMMTYTVIDTNY